MEGALGDMLGMETEGGQQSASSSGATPHSSSLDPGMSDLGTCGRMIKGTLKRKSPSKNLAERLKQEWLDRKRARVEASGRD